jgi:hypothetical protein
MINGSSYRDFCGFDLVLRSRLPSSEQEVVAIVTGCLQRFLGKRIQCMKRK